MDSMETYITTQMTAMETEMKHRYASLMEHHREEQMRLSPDDYTSRYGEVPILDWKGDPIVSSRREYPPIPPGSWAILYVHVKWRRSSSSGERNTDFFDDFICVDNYGNEYTKRHYNHILGTPKLNDWVKHTNRKVMLTNRLIDTFQTDAWFTRRETDKGVLPSTEGLTGEQRTKVLNFRKIYETKQPIGKFHRKEYGYDNTPHINRIFLNALCKIAEDYNKRFIRYADLYRDGKLREYDELTKQIEELTEDKERYLHENETLVEKSKDLTDTVQSLRAELLTIKEKYQETTTELRELKVQTTETIQELEKNLSNSDVIIQQEKDRHTNKLETLTRSIERKDRTIQSYRKQNAALEEDMSMMVPREEFRVLQQTLGKTQRKYEYLLKQIETDASLGSSKPATTDA